MIWCKQRQLSTPDALEGPLNLQWSSVPTQSQLIDNYRASLIGGCSVNVLFNCTYTSFTRVLLVDIGVFSGQREIVVLALPGCPTMNMWLWETVNDASYLSVLQNSINIQLAQVMNVYTWVSKPDVVNSTVYRLRNGTLHTRRNNWRWLNYSQQVDSVTSNAFLFVVYSDPIQRMVPLVCVQDLRCENYSPHTSWGRHQRVDVVDIMSTRDDECSSHHRAMWDLVTDVATSDGAKCEFASLFANFYNTNSDDLLDSMYDEVVYMRR
jgi:hypothetical protein